MSVMYNKSQAIMKSISSIQLLSSSTLSIKTEIMTVKEYTQQICNKMKHSIILTLLLISTGLLHAQNSEIEKVFTEINSLVASKDVDEIVAHYNQANDPILEESQNHYKNLIQLDSLSYVLKANRVYVEGDTATAIVFEDKSYYKYERNHTELKWSTFTLIKAKNDWVINEVHDRNYQQAKFVELNMEFHPTKRSMVATARVEFSILKEGQTNLLFLLNRGLSIKSITNSKGVSLPFKRSGLSVEIPWKSDLVQGENIVLNFHYSGEFYNEFAELGYSLVNIGEEGCFANFVTEWYP